MTQAGWYADPDVPGGLRYWDGNAWTEHRTAPAAQPAAPQAPAAYGASPGARYGLPPAKTTDGMSIAALVLGIAGVIFPIILTGILGLVFGIIGLNNVNSSNDLKTGKGLAIAGIVLGSIGILVGIAVLISAMNDPDFYD